MTNRIDAVMDPVELAVVDPSRDAGLADSGAQKLPPAHNAVLTLSERSDPRRCIGAFRPH